jgi:hypothetical protein
MGKSEKKYDFNIRSLHRFFKVEPAMAILFLYFVGGVGF